MTRKARAWVWLVSLTAAVAALVGVCLCLRGSGPNDLSGGEEFRYGPLKTVTAYLAMIEKPDAANVLLADEGALAYRAFFANAGLDCATNAANGARYDIVFMTGFGDYDWNAVTGQVAESGVVAWALDLRKTSMAGLRDALRPFPCVESHLWMPSEEDWLVAGRPNPMQVLLSDQLDLFTREGTVDDLSKAECDALPLLFSCYVGTLEDVAGAFRGDLSLPVRPEYFLPREIPQIDWIVGGETEDDIREQVSREIRSMQVVRRMIVEGNMLAAGKNGMEAAFDRWAAAFARNPHDPMLLARLYRLAVSAKTFEQVGNLRGAAKCYETMIAIRPKDLPTLRQYAVCLRLLGMKELEATVRRRIRELSK